MRIRGKRMGWTMAAAVLLLSAIAAGWWWKTAALNGKAAGGSASVWAERANMAQAELTKSFWDEKRKLYNNASPCMMQACTDPFNYWWLAHAVDLAADGWLRTGDETYKQRLAALHQGILDRNAGVWPNDYYDDIAWMGLAWLRAFDATQEPKYKEAALVLWEDIKTGWNEEMGGGIAWRKEQLNYKNTPANAPSVILSARLYQRFGDKANLDWAMRIYDWEKRNLVDPESGLVWDGVNRTGNGLVDKDWVFTYNQGTFIGAGVEMFRATKQQAYLDDARKTAGYLADHMTSPVTGMLPNEGEGDGSLFKGVLVRYLGELIAQDGKPEKWVKLLTANADSLWKDGKAKETALFGLSWSQSPDTVVQLGAQISGTALLEQMARLEREGKTENRE